MKLKCKGYALEIGERTLIMGVVNVTPDSFSDGGLYLDKESAVNYAKRLVGEGADIIDVGGESTRPFSEPVSIEEELGRVLPVIKTLSKEIEVPISIDTYKAEVASKALEAGASIVNDITGLSDKRMAEIVAESDVPVIIMHMKGTPKDMQENPQYDDVVREILAFFRERIERGLIEGIKRDKMLIDPGIGFGKTVEHNLEIIRRLDEFKILDKPLVIGTSRKSFIGKVLGLSVEERLEGTLATITASIMKGADIVRVHDVKECKRTAMMTDAIVRGFKGND